MDKAFSQQAVGTGSGSEALMDTNPSFTVIADHTLQISDYIPTYQGAGTIRIRKTDINGDVMLVLRIAADGMVVGDFKTPLPLEGGSAGTTYVITQEGSFDNSFLLVGMVVPT
jgi:hypothetical protein